MENFHHCSLAHVHFTFRMSVHRPNVADCWWKKNGYWGSLFIPVYPFWSMFIPFYHPCLFLFIRVISFYPWILKMSVKILRHPRINRHIYFLASRFHSSGSSVEACGNKKNASFNVANNQDLYSPKTEPKAHGWTKNPVFPGLWPWLKL